MTADPLPLHPLDGDAAGRRRRDLVDRLEWVLRRRLEELPDTLVAALLAAGVVCDRGSRPQALIDRLREGAPEIRAAS